MPQLIVRQIEEKVVRKLKEWAGQHGVSMEEEHDGHEPVLET